MLATTRCWLLAYSRPLGNGLTVAPVRHAFTSGRYAEIACRVVAVQGSNQRDVMSQGEELLDGEGGHLVSGAALEMTPATPGANSSHCWKMNGVRFRTHASRSSVTHSGFVGRALKPLSPRPGHEMSE